MADWISWTPDLMLNVQAIDDQHRELIKRFNDLGEAVWDGKGKEEIVRIIDFVSEYTVFHFAAEETLMRNHGFPEYQGHKKAHDNLVEEVVRFRSGLEKTDAKSELVIAVVGRLGEWTREHIRKMDKELAKFLTANT
jgi:hemerythrin